MEEKTEKRMIEGLGQGYYPACEPKQAKYLYRIGMFAAMNHKDISALQMKLLMLDRMVAAAVVKLFFRERQVK